MRGKRIQVLLVLIFAFQTLVAQKEYRLNNVKFVGNKVLSSEKLLKQINTQPKKRIEKLLIWKRNPEFTSFVLENDINRIKTFYIRNGFTKPEISYKLDSIKFHRINVIINVNENDYVKINRVKLDIKNDTLESEITDLISSKIILKPGDRFVDENVFNSEFFIQQYFSNNGYPLAKSNYQIQLFKEDLLANVIFDIYPGAKCYIGEIFIHGDSVLPSKIIQRNLNFSTGDLYNQQLINKSQQQIFDTDLFQYVIIRSLKDSIKENQIPIEIFVRELPRWIFETGLGYGTDDRLRLSLNVIRSNFLGGARKLIFRAKTSFYTPYNFELKFVQPNFFIQDLAFIINPFYVQEREKSYEIDRLGGGLSLQYQLSKKVITVLTYTFEKDYLLEISDLQLNSSELEHNKSLVSLGTRYKSTDNVLNPTSGTKMTANISYSGLGSKAIFHFYKIDFSLQNYFPLSSETTLATKLKAGVMQAIQNDPETPIEDRYFAGGASSLRGWERHEIYPLNIDSTAIGGNTLFEGSIELRYPIYDIVRGSLFVDFGNVWANSYSYNLASLHYNLGVGLHVKTPIGPVRLDIATPFINNEFGFQFFISIGYAF